jgi:hypothetical protein
MEPGTKTSGGWAIVLLAFLVVSPGCTGKKSEESTGKTSAPAQAQPSEPARGSEPAASPTPGAAARPEQPSPTHSSPVPTEAASRRAKKDPARVTPPPAAAPEPRAEPTRPEEPKPAPTGQSTSLKPEKPVAPESTKVVAADVVVLKGSPLGGVRFEHKLHTDRAGNKCETCHHSSKPEKPATAPQQACSDCHTKVAVSPMKTKYQAAFHNPMAQSGTCVDCHKAQSAKGKKAPVKCAECHKKENT